MAQNNYLANLLELNDQVINDISDKYKAYTFGVATLLQESLKTSTQQDILDTLDYGVAMVAEISEILNPALLDDVDYFTKVEENLKAWQKSANFAKSLQIQ